jgi:predicted DNA binding CopG/RHH family protein
MKKDRFDLNMPIGKLTRVPDFLPSPKELMADEQTVKVTLRLSEDSIKTLKQYAQKYHTKYQRIIRRIVDSYAKQYAMHH